MKRPWVTQTTSAAGPETVCGCNRGGILPFVQALSGSTSTETRPKPNKKTLSTLNFMARKWPKHRYTLAKHHWAPWTPPFKNCAVHVIQNALNRTMNPPSFELRQSCHLERLHHSLEQVSTAGIHIPSRWAKCWTQNVSKYQSSNITQMQQLPTDDVYINIYTPIARTNEWEGRSRKVRTCLRRTSHIWWWTIVHISGVREGHVLFVCWRVGTTIKLDTFM